MALLDGDLAFDAPCRRLTVCLNDIRFGVHDDVVGDAQWVLSIKRDLSRLIDPIVRLVIEIGEEVDHPIGFIVDGEEDLIRGVSLGEFDGQVLVLEGALVAGGGGAGHGENIALVTRGVLSLQVYYHWGLHFHAGGGGPKRTLGGKNKFGVANHVACMSQGHGHLANQAA